MPAQLPVQILTDAARNLATIRYFGKVTATEMQAAVTEIEGLLPQLQTGFTVLADLSGLESMDLDCVPHLTKIMDVSRARGIGTVVRVIPDPDKDIGLNILSIIHYRRGVQIVTCETLAEAERALAPPKK
jgi:anti-anti-sigma regulatory factor